MNKFKLVGIFILWALIIVPLFIYPSPLHSASDSVQESLTTASTSGDSAAIYDDNYGAMQFTTTTNAHIVTKIRLKLKVVGAAVGTVYVSIRTAAAGLPNSTEDVITFDARNGSAAPFAVGYSWITFNVASDSPSTVLSGGTQYAIIVSAPVGTNANYVMWELDTDGGAGTINHSHSTDAGVSWTTDSPKDALFEVWGSQALSIVSVKEFDGYLVSSPKNDMLFTFEYINICPPYFENNYDPTQYFSFQLLNTVANGSGILAQTPMKAWGDRPGSIYLNASSATSITRGSALQLKMVDVTGTIYTTYPMVSADWRGSANTQSTHTTNYMLNIYDKITGLEVSPLDNWVRDTASSMDKYYGYSGTTSYTKYIQNRGKVLSTSSGGDSLFINGIPSLNYVRPNLFEVVTAQMPIDTTDWTNAYNNGTNPTFETQVGTTIADDMDNLGDLFGISASAADPSNDQPAISIAQKTMGTLLMILAVMIALFGLLAAGSGFAPVAMFLSMPIMFWGAQIRAIDIRLIGLIIFILFILCIRRYIWVEG